MVGNSGWFADASAALPHKSDKFWKFVSASSVVSPQITLVFGGGAS
jgi:hypothetical protein